MKIYVVGNILVEKDSLPLRILSKLRKTFAEVDFIEIDPNENFIPFVNEPLYIIDTVVGIKDIQIFHDIAIFSKSPSVSLHDYDLLFHLQLLKKLNKLPSEIKIFAIPPDFDENLALKELTSLVKNLSNQRKRPDKSRQLIA